MNPSNFIDYLTSSDLVIPNYSVLKKMANDQKKNTAFISLFGTSQFFDQRLNPVKTTINDTDSYLLNVCYNFDIQYKISTLDNLIIKSVIRNIFNYEQLSTHFRENTWLNTNIRYNNAKGDIVQYNWIHLICEPLREYFNQLDYVINSGFSIQANFILCIDSLVTKVEGLIRDLFTLHGVPTVNHKNEKKSNLEYSEEKDLNLLLHDEFINELFDESEVHFFRYLYTDKTGLNIRNRVAHSLMFSHEYSFSIMNLIIISILKIGKYVINKDAM